MAEPAAKHDLAGRALLTTLVAGFLQMSRQAQSSTSGGRIEDDIVLIPQDAVRSGGTQAGAG